jgi:hypothetical protein
MTPEEKIEAARRILGTLNGDAPSGLPTVGDRVFVRTVTYHYTGEVAAVSDGFLALTEAAWVADSGRFTAMLASGSLAEVEPYPDGVAVRVALAAIVDWCPWPHALPRQTK